MNAKYLIFLVFFNFLGLWHCAKEKVVYLNNEQQRTCVEYTGFDPCGDPITIGPNDNMATTRMDLTDGSIDEQNLWDIVKRNAQYVGKPGENVTIIMAEIFGKNLKVSKVCLSVRHTSQVTVATFVRRKDTYPKELELLNKVFDISPENRNSFTKVCMSKTKFTFARMIFKLDDQTPDGNIHIQKLQLDACATTIGKNDIIDIKYPTVKARTFRTPIICTTLKSSVEDPSFFIFEDHDPERNISIALKDSNAVYVGAPNRNISLTISMFDKGDTELWRTCKTVKNVKTAEYWIQEGDVIYKKVRKICSCKEWTKVCFGPWEQGIVVRSINVNIMACDEKDTSIEMKDLFVLGCRDHWAHQYTLYTNPGDTRVLRLDTVRNQTITIFGEKNAQGLLMHTKMVHFTDYTENFGGNIRYFIGQNLFIRKILTEMDTITFDWDLKNKKVQVKVVARNGEFRVNKIIDLREVLAYSQTPQFLHLRFKRKSPKSKIVKVNVIVKQCKKLMNDVFVHSVVTKGKERAEIIGLRNEEANGLYEIILPKKKAPRKVTNICRKYTQVKSKECKVQGIITRDRYTYVCNQMITILANFTQSQVVDGFRLREACINAFKVDMRICRATTSSPNEDGSAYFTAACKSQNNFQKEDLFSKIGKKFKMKLYARNDEAHVTEEPEQDIDVNKIKPFDATVIVMKGVLLDFVIVPNIPLIRESYKVQIHHSCMEEEKGRSIIITLKQAKRIIDDRRLCSGKLLINECLCCEIDVEQSEDTVPPVVDEFVVTVSFQNGQRNQITFLSTFE